MESREKTEKKEKEIFFKKNEPHISLEKDTKGIEKERKKKNRVKINLLPAYAIFNAGY